jgi:hypothetical protein
MTEQLPNRWRYWSRRYAKATAVCLVVLLIASYFTFRGPQPTPPPCPPDAIACQASTTGNLQPPSDWPAIVAAISAIGTVVSAICTVTTVFLAWRKDRREALDLKLKVAEVERAAKQGKSFDS